MDDKEALEHILKQGDELADIFASQMPHDLDIEKFARAAGRQIVRIVKVTGHTTECEPVVRLVAGLAGCILRLRFNTEVTAMLKAEEANND